MKPSRPAPSRPVVSRVTAGFEYLLGPRLPFRLTHLVLVLLTLGVSTVALARHVVASPSPQQPRPQTQIKKEPEPAPLQKRPSTAARLLSRRPRDYSLFPPSPASPGVLAVTTDDLFENVAQVIGPQTNSACPGGQVVLQTWSWDKPKDFLLRRNLYEPSGWYDASAATLRATLDLDGRSELEIRGDPILIKDKDGNLLAFRLMRTWEPVQPKPDWWDHFTMEHCNNHHGCRGGAGVWRSIDCGSSWELLSVIDPYSFENGDYARPRPNRDSLGAIVDTTKGWHGSFDRIEAYADPWNGYLYFSTYVEGGPRVDYQTGQVLGDPGTKRTHFLLRSEDRGRTWKLLKKLDHASTPLMMTSTPNGRLYVFTVIGTSPTLYYTLIDTTGVVFSDPKLVHFLVTKDGQREPLPAGIDGIYANLDNAKKYTNSISRITASGPKSEVRLSYQFVDDDTTTALAVVRVEIPNDHAEPIVSPIRTFHSVNPASSILSAGFIDPDPPSVGSGRANSSVLYWVEGSSDPTVEAYARYSIFSGESGSTEPAILGGPWKPTVSVAHYMYGGAFSTPDGSLNYLGQWVQSDGIRANIVSIPPYSPGTKVTRGGEPRYNVDLPGSDIADFNLETPPTGVLDLRQNQCAEACWQNNRCVAWTYVRPNTTQGPEGRCWLKNRVPAEVSHPCCVSGTVGEPSTDRPGGDYLRFDNIFGHEITPQFCRSICFQQARCKAWTFVKPNTGQGPKGACWLKEIIPPPVKHDCCISGYFQSQVIR